MPGNIIITKYGSYFSALLYPNCIIKFYTFCLRSLDFWFRFHFSFLLLFYLVSAFYCLFVRLIIFEKFE